MDSWYFCNQHMSTNKPDDPKNPRITMKKSILNKGLLSILIPVVNKKKTIIYCFLTFILLNGCYYDNERDLYGDDACEELTPTFSAGVLSIFNRDCYQCHTNALMLGNVSLEGYENVIPYVEDGSLLGSVEHINGFSPMPKDRNRLTDCEVKIIRDWIEQGALDN